MQKIGYLGKKVKKQKQKKNKKRRRRKEKASLLNRTYRVTWTGCRAETGTCVRGRGFFIQAHSLEQSTGVSSHALQ